MFHYIIINDDSKTTNLNPILLQSVSFQIARLHPYFIFYLIRFTLGVSDNVLSNNYSITSYIFTFFILFCFKSSQLQKSTMYTKFM